MPNVARAERRVLCDVALEVGPDAPTLCSPWTVADLLAHIILRETRPDLAVGIMTPAFADRLERHQSDLAKTDFRELVRKVRGGPPVWNPARLEPIDMATNLGEFFVHTEDIRRPAGMPPRPADPVRDRALAAGLKRLGPLMYRQSPVGVVLHADGGRPREVHKPTDLGSVTVRGPVGEVFLVSYGRHGVAEATIEGSDEAVAALKGASLGLA